MESKHIRSFEIEHTKFSLESRRGLVYLQSLHPYDDHEYHWAARDTDGGWRVFKGDRYRMRLAPMEPEAAAEKLLACDRAHRALLESFGI